MLVMSTASQRQSSAQRAIHNSNTSATRDSLPSASFAMNPSCVCFLRLLQCAVAVVAMVSLCGIFHPVKVPGQPSLILETSYSVNAAVLMTTSAAMYSGILCVLLSRPSLSRLSPTRRFEMTVDIALSILLLLVAIVLMDSDDLYHCHESIYVRCRRFVASIALTMFVSLLFGISAGLALFELPTAIEMAAPVPETPVGPVPKEHRFHAATTQ
ncbi:hypothetical protein H310_13800 [Aphanomyces invadans]|uniref:MARVEL domain-containing protein n=1 Tax=Aphanomyces invadans TaxID=157072 RepID=A0A024TCJ5_9STRA|nr:hypothetical protein H310_13800 [Aphanomyces invadans]ETV91734.1 hypothetical protein H310_13800 [Aphanomyces invadans]|eukprot:XP_008879660.1 hypothetical protein H310_13800 [Aphanomyces invadans]